MSARTRRSSDQPERVLAVWVPDWPLVAAGVGSDEPAAVFVANRVVAATPAARAAGVRRHMRRREAQARCPALAVLERDAERDARRFEPVVQALEAFTPRIEVARPGRAAFPTRGPSRYFGGDRALAERIIIAVQAVLAHEPPGTTAPIGADDQPGRANAPILTVGVADGPFAAEHAARTAYVAAQRGEAPVWIVEPGAQADYLAPLSLDALDRPELTEVLHRLGLRTLRDFAGLAERDVLGRFGPEGAEAHRLARGLDARPLRTEPAPPDLVVTAELDPPAEQVAPAAFAARGLADELRRRLDARGSVCTRVVVVAETENGERSERVWRHASTETGRALTAGAIADRVRWQLDGWLNASVRQRPTAGIAHLEIHPDEVTAADGRQLGFWGADPGTADRAARAIARVQGLLGAEAVSVPEYAGGREPAEQLRLVPAGAVDLTADRPAARPDWVSAPWPGQLPHPAPATVLAAPTPVDVLDATGRSVRVDGRGTPTAAPDRLRLDGRTRRITSWAGPWPVDERWWDPERHSRRARFQVVTDDGTARLVVLERGRWAVTATYD
ncbi:MAG: DNA polymerase Y family protein [Acidimicrobiales bacterium]|nr:DNA polymerase Y family protein [Acidimicrobiales bacterium]